MIAPRFELVPVDEEVLEELVSVAVDDADPDEVAPPRNPTGALLGWPGCVISIAGAGRG